MRTNRHVATAALMAQALLGSAAWAQSSVSISGLVDVGVYRGLDKTTQVGSIQRSNIQFSGSEDLGGGLRATFALSHRFDPSTGMNESADKPFFHGQSTVGLAGAFGSVQFGRRLDAIWANDFNYDPWYNFHTIASPAWDLWHYGVPSDPTANNGKPDYGRLNNGVFYDSPSMGGVTVHLSGSPERDAAARNRPYSAALQYKGGPITAMVGHAKNSEGSTDRFYGLKASFSAFAVMGVYDTSRFGASRARAKTLGASYNLQQWLLRAGWGRVDVDGVRAEQMVSVGAAYNLSKRTSVYADIAHKSFPTRSGNTYGVGVAHAF